MPIATANDEVGELTASWVLYMYLEGQYSLQHSHCQAGGLMIIEGGWKQQKKGPYLPACVLGQASCPLRIAELQIT